VPRPPMAAAHTKFPPLSSLDTNTSLMPADVRLNTPGPGSKSMSSRIRLIARPASSSRGSAAAVMPGQRRRERWWARVVCHQS
jgi:hypothetical protein